MPPWLSIINSLLRNESNKDSSRWIQLATIGIDNTPRVRTVVFRGWSALYEMEIFTDKRSLKFDELNLNNNVEICWFFSKALSQFRFRGRSIICLGKDNLNHWNQLSEKSKSMWSWPRPGDKFFFGKKYDFSVNVNDEVSENFALLKIEITHVDHLLLGKPVHTRRRWVRKNEWIEERINP